jgi:hypothetical protein
MILALAISPLGSLARLATFIPYDLSVGPSLILCKNIIAPSLSFALT